MTGPGSERDWALFLDFDGTLVDIAPTPDAVVVEPGLLGTLSRLRDRLDGAVAIVTGRTVASLDRFFPDVTLDACGLHGLERRLGGRLSMPTRLAELDQEVAALRARFAAHPGVVIEDKGIGVAVHWRQVPAMADEVAGAAADLAGRLGPGYRIQDGKAVREIVPAHAGKGAAIRALMGEPPYLGRLPVFIGDDRTDEDGFRSVNDLGGVSVKVGAGETAAGFRLPDAAAARAWLARWSDTPPKDLDRA